MTGNMNNIQIEFNDDTEIAILSYFATPTIDSVSVLKKYSKFY